MTQEDKELLLKELCARLPYGVICSTPEGDGHLCSINQTLFGNEYGINIKATKRSYFSDRECEVRPYLRPMSSMTEEEKKEMHEKLSPKGTAIYKEEGISTPVSHYGDWIPYKYMSRNIDWLNTHHFDYCGLIDMGLAIEVTEENNPYKE